MPLKITQFLFALGFFTLPTKRSFHFAMAWRSSGNTNAELVANLRKSRIFTDDRIEKAMLAVDRGDFTGHLPYQDSPQGIGWNATISAPHMHAAALEGLKDHLKPGARVLDVGSGSGYLTACFARMVAPNGKVIGIEHIDQLADVSKVNIQKHHSDMFTSGLLEIIVGDGRLGHAIPGGYTAIHVGAAAETVPQPLIDQMAPGGRMLIPVGPQHGNQVFLQIDKSSNGQEITKKVIEHVIYVPLTSKSHQIGGS
ncbi:unnamed protein product, partial [Mesorhabditis belari]|uniref:Protein-L-isoaspartate(D-aspartate) O-methyltransferase n=1 Tax=Mesorhabditis belari TaxID=2138241 RepID=A0AAF3FVD2_9BILA